jgi:3-oxoacyl-[acyl-carrier-protein] synthase III
MALFTIPRLRIAGLAAAVPVNREPNASYSWIPAREREQLMKTVGVVEKRVISKGTTTSDLCFSAAEKLLDGLGWGKKEIGVLIFVSQTRDYLIPATSGILQDRLGLSRSTLVFDVNQGCSGFVYGLSLMGSIMTTAGLTKGLLLAGDISSLNASYRDKSTHPLFGDAGTACAVELSDDVPGIHFNLEGDGSGHEAIIIRDGGFRHILGKDSFKYRKYGSGIYRNKLNIELNGIEVFNFSLREVVPNIRGLIGFTGRSLDETDYVVFHQANRLINETLRKMLKLDPAKVPYSIRNFGNTSSASIPLTIVSELGAVVRERPLKLLLSAFGIGLSWGSVLVDTTPFVCPEVIEYEKP